MHVNKKILLFLLCQSLLIIHYAPHLCGTNKDKLYIERQPNAAPTVALYGRFNSFYFTKFLIFHAYSFIFSYICVFISIWSKQRWSIYILIIRDNAMQRTFLMHQRVEQKIKAKSSNEAHQTKPIPIMLNLLQKTELIFEFHLLHLNIFFWWGDNI